MAEAAIAKRKTFHHGDLRSQLILVVSELVEEKGPDGFSIAEAARLAGVSSGAPYRHFEDRPALLRAVAQDGLMRLRSDMINSMEGTKPGSLEAITAAGLAYVTFAKAQPGVFRLIFALTDGHEQCEELNEIGEQTFAVVLQATADYVNQPVDSAPVRETAYLLWTVVHGHAFLSIDEKRKEDPSRPDDRYYVERASRGVLDTHDTSV